MEYLCKHLSLKKQTFNIALSWLPMVWYDGLYYRRARGTRNIPSSFVVVARLEAVSLSQRIFPTGFACKCLLHMESRHFKASNPGTPTAHAASTKDTTHGQPYAALKETLKEPRKGIVHLLEAKQARTMPCHPRSCLALLPKWCVHVVYSPFKRVAIL